MKKQLWYFYALGAGILFFLLLPISAGAEANVLDCLENDEGCNEEEVNTNQEQPQENDEDTMMDNNDNAFLVEDDNSGASMGWQIVRLVIGLALVLGLVYIVLKFLGKKNGFNQQPGILRNVSGVSVGSNKSVQIIQAGNKYYLIGVGDNVELLEEINDSETLEQLLNQPVEKKTDALSFFSKGKNAEADKSSGASFNQLLNKELKSIRKNRQDLIQKHKEDRNE
ncbi:flagellar biosynthetic protein FliO [Oceanobacillus locisalsi]|uniref:Flagellar biosynthetic protein FliO n=1 Tax=Oceanobacillus locisalsi TaxID=546107 RepID=A0ABW3NJ47_9BACI